MKGLVLAVATAATLIGCQQATSSHDIKGVFTFRDLGECQGFSSDGYGDINSLTQVTLTDEAGKVLAVASLGAGASSGSTSKTCVYTFDFGQVPVGPTFYAEEVSKRGKITESAAALEAAGWTFNTTLGGN